MIDAGTPPFDLLTVVLEGRKSAAAPDGEGAQYIGDHREHGGVMVPHRRRVYPLGPNDQKIPERLLVLIDIGRVEFESAQKTSRRK